MLESKEAVDVSPLVKESDPLYRYASCSHKDADLVKARIDDGEAGMLKTR